MHWCKGCENWDCYCKCEEIQKEKEVTKEELKKAHKKLEKQQIEDASKMRGAVEERFAIFQFIQEKFDTIIKSFENSFENACESVAEIEQELEAAKRRAESAQTFLIVTQELRNHFNAEEYEATKALEIKEGLAQPDVPEELPEYDKDTGGFKPAENFDQFLELVDFWKKHARGDLDGTAALEELEKHVDLNIVENAAKSVAELEQEVIAEEKAEIEKNGGLLEQETDSPEEDSTCNCTGCRKPVYYR